MAPHYRPCRLSKYPAVNKAMDGRLLAPARQKTPIRPETQQTVQDISDIKQSGWLHTQEVKALERAQERAWMQHQKATKQLSVQILAGYNEREKQLEQEDGEIAELLEAYEASRDDKGEDGADEQDGEAQDGDDGDSGYDEDSKAAKGAKARKAAARKRFMRSRAIAGAPLNAKGMEADWETTHQLLQQGIRNTKVPKHKRSDRACLDPIPELEDGDFKLRPHQQEAVGWWEYITKLYGCFLLGDDMGVGKTPVTVARIRREIERARQAEKELKQAGAEVKLEDRPHWLIVVPLSLLSNWEKEFARCPSISLCVYHSQTRGSQRELPKSDLEKYDVILTTYDVLRAQYSELRQAQADFLDFQAGRGDMIESRMQEEHTKRHGSKPTTASPRLKSDRPHAPLLSIDFFEGIIDEAHTIRGLKNVRGYALCHVKARYRVCLTGTPMQNGMWDVFSLLRFMRHAPLDRQPFFKLCFINRSKKRKDNWRRVNKNKEIMLGLLLASVMLRRGRMLKFEGKPLADVKQWQHNFCKIKLKPSTQATQEETRPLWDLRGYEEQKEARETKAARSSKSVHAKQDILAVLGRQLKQGKQLKPGESKAIFLQMYEARMNCNHLRLIHAGYGDTTAPELEDRTEINHIVANLALDIDDPSRHVAPEDIHDLAEEAETAGPRLKDSVASRPAPNTSQKQWERNREKFRSEMRKNDGWHSEKMLSIMECLRLIMLRRDGEAALIEDEGERQDFLGRNKIVIFSEYLAALDIVEIGILEIFGISALRFDGHCNTTERDYVVKTFEEAGKAFEEPGTKADSQIVLLATLNAASEGLNLVHARYALFIAPGWNPFNFEQAVARLVRIGQTYQVEIYRFLVLESIELRIMDVETVKRHQASCILNNAKLLDAMPSISKFDERRMANTLETGAGTAMRQGFTAKYSKTFEDEPDELDEMEVDNRNDESDETEGEGGHDELDGMEVDMDD